MPFWKRTNKATNGSITSANPQLSNGTSKQNENKVDYKARLEHKLYLVQENPEPIFDLSECGLKDVPGGTYSKCKILRKEALYLQNNKLLTLFGGGDLKELSSLLKVLDLSSNLLEKLPDELGSLENLSVLNIRNNRLKSLPSTLHKLSNLTKLDVSSNNIKILPDDSIPYGKLRSLILIDNVKLKTLPTMGMTKSRKTLTDLQLDHENFVSPPSEICALGTTDILKYLCKECTLDFDEDSVGEENGSCESDDKAYYDKLVSDSINITEKHKEAKSKEMLALEKLRLEELETGRKVASALKEDKSKLLSDLVELEEVRDENLRKIQFEKEKEKVSMLSTLNHAEAESDSLLAELMRSKQERCDPELILKQMESERQQIDDMLDIKAGETENLRQREILNEMKRTMQEEMEREANIRKYEMGRNDIIASTLNSTTEEDERIEDILKAKKEHRNNIIDELLEDEHYQRKMFTTLLIDRDVKHNKICDELSSVQLQLTNLTHIEIANKSLKVEYESQLMQEKRKQLSEMLIKLMQEKDERSKQLEDRLKEAEDERVSETNHYWLIQYQRLLDSKPKGVVEAEQNIDPMLKDFLTENGLFDDVGSLFALHNVTMKEARFLTESQLHEMGIHNTFVQQKVMVCLRGDMDGRHVPSAPPIPTSQDVKQDFDAKPKVEDTLIEPNQPQPSAPSIIHTFQSSNDCVVCLEKKCEIIFLPCGHVCCCRDCCDKDGSLMTECPMCRMTILQRCFMPNPFD